MFSFSICKARQVLRNIRKRCGTEPTLQDAAPKDDVDAGVMY